MKQTIIFGIVLSVSFAAVTAMSQQTTPATPASAPAPSLTITRMEICGSVMDRKPVDIASTFTANQDKVYCYLEFKDVNEETTVNVVWTLGQNEMGKVPLSIKPYAKFRTWSSKSINGMKGDWKVDVVDETGVIIKTAMFKVQ